MRWIIVDGIDGSGKSTVARWIEEHYSASGEKVVLVTHPSASFVGRASRRFLESKGKVARLAATVFFIADVLCSLTHLRRWKKEAGTLIFVRYLMATAYLPEKLAPKGYEFFRKVLPSPRRLLLVDIRPEVALARIEARNEKKEMFEDLTSLEKTRRKVLMLADLNGWDILDNSGTEEQTRPGLEKILVSWDGRSD
jgi:dTMP kinase